ncbi:MAG: 50S ribosomal protein L30 [Candidatus Thorarchaeota archaeon]
MAQKSNQKKPTKKTTKSGSRSKVQTQKPSSIKTGDKKEFNANKRFVVIRIRGKNNVRKDINDTIDLLNLRRINNLSFIDNRPSYLGMLQKSKDFITWGEPSTEIITQLFKKWARVTGDKPLTEEFVKNHSKYKSIDEFVKDFLTLKAEISDIENLKPFFRLHPPRRGFPGKGIKYSYKANGALGYRGEAINDLIARMAGL